MQFFKNTDCKDYYFYCFLATFSHRKYKSKKNYRQVFFTNLDTFRERWRSKFRNL